jgi:hypothetical protein
MQVGALINAHTSNLHSGFVSIHSFKLLEVGNGPSAVPGAYQ